MRALGRALDRGAPFGYAAAVMDTELHRHNLAWLVRLRWGGIAAEALATAVIAFGLGVELPLRWLVALGVVQLGSNALAAGLARRREVRAWMLAVFMAVDVVLLTLAFAQTGGPSNPFTVLYLVYIALGAVVLGSLLTWGLVALAFACFGSLFLVAEISHVHDAAAMAAHIRGMWLAFGGAACFIVYFVSRVTRSLAQRELELAEARAAASRSEHLASLATLAAGAAHELSTPLSTIAVVSKELERALATGVASNDTVSDARLIRTEVHRCREILDQLAMDAGHLTAERFEEFTIATLVKDALSSLPDASAVDVTLGEAAVLYVYGPRRALTQAMRSIVKNALDASPANARVELRVSGDEGVACVEIEDHGEGVSAELMARVGEPFFTTKEPGRGMGLGVFVARLVHERLGGALRFESRAGHGTKVTLVLPAHRKVAP